MIRSIHRYVYQLKPDQKLRRCPMIGQLSTEVTRSSATFLGGVRGDLCEGVDFPGSLQLNLCLTLFSGKSPPLITGCCTPLIGRWKRGFGFQGWWPAIHVARSSSASADMRPSTCFSFGFRAEDFIIVNMYVRVGACASSGSGFFPGWLIPPAMQ